MRMHACQLRGMRTTIEIPEHQRAKLIEIATRRGLKGFSKIVQEAIERYLEENLSGDEKVKEALSVLGTLDEEQAESLESSIRELRSKWR